MRKGRMRFSEHSSLHTTIGITLLSAIGFFFNDSRQLRVCGSITTQIKMWSNQVEASRRDLKKGVYLRLRLARPCVHFWWPELTLVEIKFARKSTHVFLPFGHPTQDNATWVMSINLLSANETQDAFALKWVFATCVLVRSVVRPFGHPTRVNTRSKRSRSKSEERILVWRRLDSRLECGIECSLRRLNSSLHVSLTCGYLRPLVSPFGRVSRRYLCCNLYQLYLSLL